MISAGDPDQSDARPRAGARLSAMRGRLALTRKTARAPRPVVGVWFGALLAGGFELGGIGSSSSGEWPCQSRCRHRRSSPQACRIAGDGCQRDVADGERAGEFGDCAQRRRSSGAIVHCRPRVEFARRRWHGADTPVQECLRSRPASSTRRTSTSPFPRLPQAHMR